MAVTDERQDELSAAESARLRRWWPAVLIGAALVLLGVAGAFAWLTMRTYHFDVVQPGVLYRCGNRGMAEFSNTVGRVRPRTVVSLIDDRELADSGKPQFEQEARYLAGHGVQQVRLPVKLGGWPDTEQVRRFLAVVEDPTKQPVLIHCAQGVRRTGMFVAAYEESDMKYSPEQAKQRIESFGHGAGTMGDIQMFIDHYDPATRSVSAIAAAGGSHE